MKIYIIYINNGEILENKTAVKNEIGQFMIFAIPVYGHIRELHKSDFYFDKRNTDRAAQEVGLHVEGTDMKHTNTYHRFHRYWEFLIISTKNVESIGATAPDPAPAHSRFPPPHITQANISPTPHYTSQ